MHQTPNFFKKIRNLIAKDELNSALVQLKIFLAEPPVLDEIIQQSARFSRIRKQIRLGIVNFEDATVTQNQITHSLLELLTEIEEQTQQPHIQKEVENAVSIIDSKNVVVGDIQAGGNIHIGDVIINQSRLPEELLENRITNDQQWIQSLEREIRKNRVAVGKKPMAIFQHYGWLIEVFLQKMLTQKGKERRLRRLSFMAEVYQSSLRYLCFIQLAQLMDCKENKVCQHFFQLNKTDFQNFDFLNLLLIATKTLSQKESFVPEIHKLINDLFKVEESFIDAVFFLETYRQKLIDKQVKEEDENFETLLDDYLTALVFWLRKIAFLAKYRLVSIKDINLNYRLGTPKNFVHLYGELHGMYSELYGEQDFVSYTIEDHFTFNQSVLLFNSHNTEECLKNIHQSKTYISLSPLIIDQSVFADKLTQTPEIFYYIGKDKSKYHFAQYKNELLYGDQKEKASNKSFKVQENNNNDKLDELFEHIKKILQPHQTSSL